MEESLRVGDELEVSIEKIVFGGDGLARASSGIVFVPFSAVGDRLKVKIDRKKARVSWAQIVQVIKPGPGRAEPPCKFYGTCGGCQYQHLSYAEELRVKHEQVKEALRREGKMTEEAVSAVIAPMIASPNDLGYRNRLTVHAEEGRVGFWDITGRKLVDIDTCLLGDADVNGELTKLRGDRPLDGHYSLRSGFVPRSGFFQANTGLLDRLKQLVVEAAGSGDVLLEGYCGGGFFTQALAKKFKRVVAIDNDPRTLKDAERLNLANVEWILGDAAVELSTVVLASVNANAMVVVDPPREGLPDTVVNGLLFQRAAGIVYVSCDVATFGRDVFRLSKGYELLKVQPIDMFPRTSKVEVVSVWAGRKTSSPPA